MNYRRASRNLYKPMGGEGMTEERMNPREANNPKRMPVIIVDDFVLSCLRLGEELCNKERLTERESDFLRELDRLLELLREGGKENGETKGKNESV